MLLEEAVFALELPAGGVAIAEKEVVFFDLIGVPVIGRDALGDGGIGIVVAEGAAAIPFGLYDFEDEIVERSVVVAMNAIFCAPAVEDVEEILFVFGGEDEGQRAASVDERIFGGFSASC